MVSQEASARERVAVPASDEPAVAGQAAAEAQQEPRRLTLSQRLAQIRGSSYGIDKDNIKMSYFDKKSGEKKEFTIKGHTVEAVLAEVRPLLDLAGVLLVPNLVERTYTGNRCDVIVDFEWESLDDAADRRVVRWAGAGTDDGDKGFSKAGTNALKEHLKKLFLITDRDDAKEEEDKVEHKTEDDMRRAAVAQSEAKTKAAVEKWAKAFKVAIENAPTVEDVDRLKRDNRDQLDELPDITREFFATLIADRKAELTDGRP